MSDEPRRPKTVRRRLRVTGAGGCGLVMVAVLLLVLAGGGNSGRHVEAASASVPALDRLVGVFRRTQTPNDAPKALVQGVERSSDRQHGEDPLNARRLTMASDVAGYLWPEAGGVCYTSPGPAGCFSTELLAQRGVVVSAGRSPGQPFQVFGVARDGISNVTIGTESGQRHPIKVTDNAFYSEFTETPVVATWTNPDGTPGSQTQLYPTAEEIEHAAKASTRADGR